MEHDTQTRVAGGGQADRHGGSGVISLHPSWWTGEDWDSFATWSRIATYSNETLMVPKP